MAARRFALTLNNYQEDACDILRDSGHSIFKFFLASREVGESGTPHLQCYGELVNKASPVNLKKKLVKLSADFNRFHIEVAKGTAAQNITYCTKDSPACVEFGEVPRGQGKRTDLDDVVTKIQAGDNIRDIISSHGSSYIKFSNGIEKLYAFSQIPRNSMTIGYWLHGATGTGKSRWAHENFPDAYWKLPDCKWFDGYRGQETIIIDDYRPTKEMSLQFILRMVDRYPMTVEIKGAHVNFAPKRVIFTSPKDIPETFAHLEWIGDENLNQMYRRFPHRHLFAPGTLSPRLTPLILLDEPEEPAVKRSRVEEFIDNEEEACLPSTQSTEVDQLL